MAAPPYSPPQQRICPAAACVEGDLAKEAMKFGWLGRARMRIIDVLVFN